MIRAKLFRAVPFARIGPHDYASHEISQPGHGIVSVERPMAEVRLSASTFEGVPLTLDHPPDLLTPEAAEQAAVGLVSAVQFDEQRGQLKGDLLIWDEQAIKLVAQGLRELSGGYKAEYEPTGGGYRQRNIRGNHVALVPKGRSGAAQRIGG